MYNCQNGPVTIVQTTKENVQYCKIQKCVFQLYTFFEVKQLKYA